MLQSTIVLTSILLALFQCSLCLNVDLTVDVAPGFTECFYQDIARGTSYEVEYQVLSGGDLDVTFTIQIPSGTSVYVGNKRTGDIYKNVAMETGEYIFCMDNSFSQISTKSVFFALFVDDPNDVSANSLHDVSASPELLQYEVSLESFKNATNAVEENLQRSIQIQRQFASVELRDRSVQEYNFERVNFWSGLQLFVMVSVAIVNVLMIRGLFEDRGRAGTRGATKIRT